MWPTTDHGSNEMLSSSTFILHSRPRGIAINIAAFFLLLVDALSHPLPRGTLSFAGAEIGATAGEISLQSFTTRNRLSISSGFLCSAPLISRQGLTTNTALGQPPTWPSSLFRRGIKELALPTASASAAPATPSPSEPVRLTGSAWFAAGLLAIVLILLTGLLAGLTMGVMSVDMTRLRVWTRTGSEERRSVHDIRRVKCGAIRGRLFLSPFTFKYSNLEMSVLAPMSFTC